MKKKIAVIGANGKQGICLVNEALSRGHEVTAVIRSGKAHNSGAKTLVKDMFALTTADLTGFDAVIDAAGFWTPETLPMHTTSLRHLCNSLKGQKTRLLIVGGAGCLYVNPEHTLMLMNTPEFPEVFKAVAKATADAFAELKTRNDVLWTYLCPAADFQAEGKRTGSYKTGGENLIVNSEGNSVISYADYAIAMIDEIENEKHIQKRFCVTSK